MPGVIRIAIALWVGLSVVGVIVVSTLRDAFDETWIALALGGHAINLALVVCAAAQRKWAPRVLLVFVILGIVNMVGGVSAMFAAAPVLASATVAINAAALAGTLMMMLPEDAASWFDSRTRSGPPAAEAATRRRNVLGTAGAVVGGIVIGAAYWIADPDFTDWQAMRLTCLGEDEAPRRARLAACTETIEAGEFTGPDLADLYLARTELFIDSPHPGMQTIVHGVETALANRPSDAGALVRIGSWLSDRSADPFVGGSHILRQTAVAALEDAVRLAPEDMEARRLLGFALWRASRIDDAIAALEAARPAYPQDPVVLAVLSEGYLERDRHEDAVEAADGVLAAVPGDLNALNLRAHARLQLGRYDQVLEDVAALKQRVPDQWTLSFLELLAHCGLGDHAAARAEIDRAVSAGVTTAPRWRRRLVDWQRLDESAPEPTDDTTPGPALEAALDAWVNDGCPQPDYRLP